MLELSSRFQALASFIQSSRNPCLSHHHLLQGILACAKQCVLTLKLYSLNSNSFQSPFWRFSQVKSEANFLPFWEHYSLSNPCTSGWLSSLLIARPSCTRTSRSLNLSSTCYTFLDTCCPISTHLFLPDWEQPISKTAESSFFCSSSFKTLHCRYCQEQLNLGRPFSSILLTLISKHPPLPLNVLCRQSHK